MSFEDFPSPTGMSGLDVSQVALDRVLSWISAEIPVPVCSVSTRPDSIRISFTAPVTLPAPFVLGDDHGDCYSIRPIDALDVPVTEVQNHHSATVLRLGDLASGPVAGSGYYKNLATIPAVAMVGHIDHRIAALRGLAFELCGQSWSSSCRIVLAGWGNFGEKSSVFMARQNRVLETVTSVTELVSEGIPKGPMIVFSSATTGEEVDRFRAQAGDNAVLITDGLPPATQPFPLALEVTVQGVAIVKPYGDVITTPSLGPSHELIRAIENTPLEGDER